MLKQIIIDALYDEDIRVALLHDKKIEELDLDNSLKRQLKGNIYLAKITRVEASLQAAFVDYGEGRHGFLPFAEIHPSYYNVPIADLRKEMADASPGLARDNAADTQPDTECLSPATPDDEALADDNTPPPLPEALHDAPALDEDSPEPRAATMQAAIEMPDNATTSTEGSADIDTKNDESSASIADIRDVEEESTARPYQNLTQKYKIQEVIRKNQVMLVQVMKEERGTKGASLTTYMSLAGRYCVLMPNSPHQGGVSRRIQDSSDRARLKHIVSGLKTDDVSLIVRTAGAGQPKAAIYRDYDYLVKLWNRIREHTIQSTAPAFIHAEGDIIKRTIRDLYQEDCNEIVIQGEEAYKQAVDFMKLLLPTSIDKIQHFTSKTSIFTKYRLDEQMDALHQPVVPLPSGGYIVINPTEALVSIDVNSGRATSERNIEETAIKNNLEAAREVARQLHLRDLSGLIVIDFIDMSEARHRAQVERTLRDALHGDRARIQIGRISTFGLLEMSRQRLRPSFLEAHNMPCHTCKGTGVIRSHATLCTSLLRAIINELTTAKSPRLMVRSHYLLVQFMLNERRDAISRIEQHFDVTIMFDAKEHCAVDKFTIERMKAPAAKSGSKQLPLQLEDIEVSDFSDMPEDELPAPSPANTAKRWDRNRRERPEGERAERGEFRSDKPGGNNRRRRGNRNRSGPPSGDAPVRVASHPTAKKEPSIIRGFLKKLLD